MGMTDQRGEWRRVVDDGNRQGQGQDGETLSDEEWGTNAVSEQRGIRLLPDSDAGRAPGRVAMTSGRAIAEGDDQGQGPDPAACPGEEPGRVERPRRLRSDEAHAPRAVDPRYVERRNRGPLSARVAQRHRRGTPTTSATGTSASSPRPKTASDDQAIANSLGS
jgi:hypothetical protein